MPATPMGQPDQLIKRILDSDTERVTDGGAVREDAPEIGLTWVKGDSLLRIRKPEVLAELPAPWPLARPHVEIFLEAKMPRDHLSALELDRIDLRRLARQIQRGEDPKTSWVGEEPVWTVAPHVPAALAERRALHRVADGCYRVGPYPFEYLWIAANELPLEEALIPFLIARSGRALEAFVLWVADRRPVDWVLDVVQYTAMATAVRNELLEKFRRSEDPEVRARQQEIARKLLELNPDLQQEAEQKGRLTEVRANLRRVLARRKLAVSAEDEARIDTCSDLATLERWLDEAVTVSSATEALR